METLYAYAACALDLPLTRRLAAMSAAVRSACRAKGWDADFVPPPALHATLAVLGEIDLGLVGPLCDTLRDVGARHGPFKLQLGGLRVGPDPVSPSQLSVGVGQGAELLEALAADLAEGLERLGIERAPAPPRVLLARVRRASTSLSELISLPEALGVGAVQELVLYRAELGRTSVEPPVLARVSLGAGQRGQSAPLR